MTQSANPPAGVRDQGGTTRSDYAADAADPRIPDDSVMYLSGRLPVPLIAAAVTGERQGLLTRDDLPLDMPDGVEFLAAVQRVLEERGALAAYRAETAKRSVPAECPFWCAGDHEAMLDPLMGTMHEVQVTVVQLPAAEPSGVASAPQLVIAASQSIEEGVERPCIAVSSEDLPQMFSAAGARAVADALIKAAQMLEEIEAAASVSSK
jgi:hypothetical protein